MRDIEKYTRDYNVPNFEDYQIKYRRKKILEIIQRYKPKKILEIGCGMCPLFEYIQDEYSEYTLIEPSRIFYENAYKKALGNEKICCINDYFGINRDILKKEYHMIVCSGLLHEVEKPENIVNHLLQSCSDNTMVHINVPNANSFHRILAKEMGLIQDKHEMSERNLMYQQHTVFDIKSLTEMVESRGFKVIESGSYFFKPFTHEQMYQMIQKGIINDSVLDGLYSIVEKLPDMGSEIYVNLKKDDSKIC